MNKMEQRMVLNSLKRHFGRFLANLSQKRSANPIVDVHNTLEGKICMANCHIKYVNLNRKNRQVRNFSNKHMHFVFSVGAAKTIYTFGIMSAQ